MPRQVQAADDHGEQIVQVVGHAAGQLADGVHLLRLEHGLPPLFQRELNFLPFRKVATYLGEADQFAGRVPDRVDYDMSSEEHKPELNSLLRTSYPVFSLEKTQY